jgi:hypothetical protein
MTEEKINKNDLCLLSNFEKELEDALELIKMTFHDKIMNSSILCTDKILYRLDVIDEAVHRMDDEHLKNFLRTNFPIKEEEPKDLWDRLIDPTIPSPEVEVSLEGFDPSQLNKLLESTVSNLKSIKGIMHKLCSEYARSDMAKAGFLTRIDALLKEADRIEGCLERKEKVG